MRRLPWCRIARQTAWDLPLLCLLAILALAAAPSWAGESTTISVVLNVPYCEQILSLEYLPTGSGTTGDLSEDNPDGTGQTLPFKGGYRFFPGAASFDTRNTSRNIVRIRAVVLPTEPDLPVHFRSFDVDDPSADTDIDPNGDGRDNRGTLNGVLNTPLASHAPNGAGYRGRLRPVGGAFAAEGAVLTVNTVIVDSEARAEVELATTFAPGDNFRVVASCNKPEVVALNDTTSVPTTGPIGGGFTGKVTDQLSVWRRLHIEVDSMGIVAGNFRVGLVTGVVAGGVGQSIATTDQDLTDLGGSQGVNRFENGFLLNNGERFPVVSNTNGVNSTVTVTNIGPKTPVAGPFTRLFDDDDFNGNDEPAGLDGDTNEDVTAPDQSLMMNSSQPPPASGTGNVFAPAYVQPTYDVGDNNSAVAFVLNTPGVGDDPLVEGPLLQATYDFDADAAEANVIFWTVYLLGAYQMQTEEDCDRDTEGCTFGQVDAINGQGASVFLEVIRAGETTVSAVVNVAPTTAHEIGHLFNGDHDDLGLMSQSGSRTTILFSDTTLVRIRSIDHP